MTTLEQVIDILSDAHKDAYGFRPRGDYMARCEAMTDAEFSAEWDYLCQMIADSEAERIAAQTRAAAAFEARVADTMALGAADRATAIRWIIAAEDAEYYGDTGYAEYTLGLPYGYLTQPSAA